LGERILASPFRAGKRFRKWVAKVKLLLIGGFVGLAIGVGLTVLYFSLATFFAVNARVLNAKRRDREWQRDRRRLNRQDRRKAG